MTDLELTRKCAEAMGLEIDYSTTGGGGERNTGFDMLGRAVIDWHNGITFDPLHDDAQAMALAKRFELHIFCGTVAQEKAWHVEKLELKVDTVDDRCRAYGPDLNRAIVECVAKIRTGTADTPNPTTAARP